MRKSINEEQFVTLLMRYGPRVRAFVTTLLPLCQDAEDVAQNACLVAWRKMEEFHYSAAEPDAEFWSWVCAIGRFEALNYRRKHWGREKLFDRELLDRIASLQLEHRDHLQSRQSALQDCINRLNPRDKELVRLRYASEASVEKMAELAGRTVSAIYKALTRIRKGLSQCIESSIRDRKSSLDG